MINIEKYEDLPITDDFMFSRVFTDTQLCREVIEIISGHDTGKLDFVDSQKTFKSNQNTKGVRLDVLMYNKKSYTNLEMQNRSYSWLDKRSIYYRTMVTSHLLEVGNGYETLPLVNVIFICNFDFWGEGRLIYTFDSSCREDRDVVSNCRGVDIYININAYDNAKTEEQHHLFKYFCTNKPTNKLTRKIHKLVKKINANQIFRSDYMKYACDVRDIQRVAEERGEKRGMKRGEERGEERGIERGKKLGMERGIELGELRISLKIAEKMLDTHELSVIANFLEIPLEYVVALNDGCSVESIIEEINWD